jgi:hypothetical protein
VRNTRDLQAHVLKKGFIALDSVKKISSTNYPVEIVGNWACVGKKAVDISYSKFGGLLCGMNLAEIVVWISTSGRLHEISGESVNKRTRCANVQNSLADY